MCSARLVATLKTAAAGQRVLMLRKDLGFVSPKRAPLLPPVRIAKCSPPLPRLVAEIASSRCALLAMTTRTDNIRRHVWTAPLLQGFFCWLRRVVWSGHVFGLLTRFMTAGPDGYRGLGSLHC